MNIINTARSDKEDFFRCLFAADSIAVIGANDIVGSWGFDALRAALNSKTTKESRQVYAVNPNIPQILGLTTFKTVLDIPGPVELALIIVPAAIVPAVMRQCTQKGIPAGLIVSAGFAEVDEAGAKLQAEIVDIARKGGMHFVGPNCMGHVDGHTLVGSAGSGGRTSPGTLAIIAQSGTIGASILGNAAAHGIGISKFISTGNEADVHFEDYLEYLAQDKDTRIISGYIEGLREGRRFLQLAKNITAEKPIIVIKTGTTEQSSKAAKSHTGALAGSDVIYSAAFKQAGVIRVDDEEELCDVAVALLYQPLPRGNRIGILTMGGGFGVMTAEACEKEGLRIADLEPQTLEKLNAILPPRWSHGNPVDLVGIKHMGEDTTVSSCLKIMMEDNNIDVIVSLLPPVAPMMGPNGKFSPEQMHAMQVENQRQLGIFSQKAHEYGKTLVLLKRFNAQPPVENGAPAAPVKDKVPEYSNSRRVARVLHHLIGYRQYLDYCRG